MSAVNVVNVNNQANPELTKDNLDKSSGAVQEKNKVDKPSDVDKTATEETANKSVENKTKSSVTMTPKQLDKVAQQLQDFMGEMNRSLEFLVDKDSGRDVIKVLDKDTGDIVKQYPSEEVLTLISKLSDATGNLIDTKI